MKERACLLALYLLLKGECMKRKTKILSIMLSLILILSSCTSSKNKKSSQKEASNTKVEEVKDEDIDKAAKEILEERGLVNEAIEKPVGEAYEVGVTPDDYNMDYDTSRLHTLKEKKSKYYPKGDLLHTVFASDASQAWRGIEHGLEL